MPAPFVSSLLVVKIIQKSPAGIRLECRQPPRGTCEAGFYLSALSTSNVNPKLREMVTGMVKTLGDGLSGDSVWFRTMDFDSLPPPRCLWYENALEQRDDIALLALCFYGKERLVLLMPFFRADRIEAATLHRYLEEEYGEP